MRTLLVIAPDNALAEAIRAGLDSDSYRVIEQAGFRGDELRLLAPSIDACMLDVDLTSVEAIRTIERFRRVLPRYSLARCQTPQGFRLTVIRRAYELAAADPGFAARPATDDCGVVLRYLPGVPVGAVAGNDRNLKVTYPDDLAVAQALLDLADGKD